MRYKVHLFPFNAKLSKKKLTQFVLSKIGLQHMQFSRQDFALGNNDLGLGNDNYENMIIRFVSNVNSFFLR